MFTLSNLFEALVFDHHGPINPDIYPTTRSSKSIWQNANAPTALHHDKWKSAGNIKGMVLGITILPFPSLGAIISIESRAEPNKTVYQITISHFLECTCSDFLNMEVALIGKWGQYVNCKQVYYTFYYFYKMNYEDHKFMRSPSLSFNEVK
jgi:hypothetical protein